MQPWIMSIREWLLAGDLPGDWQVLRNDRKAIVARVQIDGVDLLAKRALTFERNGISIPARRIVREALAARWLGGFAPPALFVSKDEGILIRHYQEGSTLAESLRMQHPPPLSIAKRLREYLRFVVSETGPYLEPRGIPLTLSRKLNAAEKTNSRRVHEATRFMLGGRSPSHGDLINRNVIVADDSICLIDGETLDQASVAWDLAHLLAAPSMAGQKVEGWERVLLATVPVSDKALAAARTLSASLCLYWLDEREGRELSPSWKRRLRASASRTLIEAES